MLTHFSLFTGIGGIDLASEWAGFETVGQCEWAEFPRKVLEKHWPNIPRWRDVRDVTVESIRSRGIKRIDLLSGGYPCQPFSLAGKRKGKDDDRHLWPEMFRIIQETRPRWVIGENVAGHITMGLDEVLSNLESIGYTTQPFVIPACSVNAPHRRDRVFVIGSISNTSCIGHKRIERLRQNVKKVEEWRTSSLGTTSKLFDDIDWKERAIKSGFLGGNYGVPNRLDRIKALGNAVVPNQIYPILKTIYEIETGMISWNHANNADSSNASCRIQTTSKDTSTE